MELMFDALGGLNDIIRPGDTVGIKINLTGGYSQAVNYQNQTGLLPGETFWTHPEILRAVGELVTDAGAGHIYILEALYDWQSYSNFGYKAIGDYLDATPIDLNEKAPFSDYATRSVNGNPFIYNTLTQNAILDNLDCLISISKAKRHNGAGVTHGIKNLVGTLPLPVGLYNDGQGWRAAIHRHNLHDGNTYSNLCRVIMDLHRASPIQLVVNDAIMTVLGGEGPWGNITPANFDTLVASKDPVAGDAIATLALGYDPMAPDGTVPFPQSLNYLRLANQLGMGEFDLGNIEIIDTAPTGIYPVADGVLPNAIDLVNYPNPFNNETVFRFSLVTGGFVAITIYNALGQPVHKLVEDRLPAGIHEVKWDGKSGRGRHLPTGMYYAIMNADGHRKTHKLALIK